jgi:hypothetical protein
MWIEILGGATTAMTITYPGYVRLQEGPLQFQTDRGSASNVVLAIFLAFLAGFYFGNIEGSLSAGSSASSHSQVHHAVYGRFGHMP